MKYLKLKTSPDLGKNHITFAYFGKVVVEDRHAVANLLNILSSFTLKKSHADFFGENKDIPVVVYTIEGDKERIMSQRLKVLKMTNVLDQNYEDWTPHISNLDYDLCPDTIHVSAINSNDLSFGIIFIDLLPPIFFF